MDERDPDLLAPIPGMAQVLGVQGVRSLADAAAALALWESHAPILDSWARLPTE